MLPQHLMFDKFSHMFFPNKPTSIDTHHLDKLMIMIFIAQLVFQIIAELIVVQLARPIVIILFEYVIDCFHYMWMI